MTVPWYIVFEGWLFLPVFIIESTDSCRYLLSIRSCLILLIFLLNPFDPDAWLWLFWPSYERLLFSHDRFGWAWNIVNVLYSTIDRWRSRCRGRFYGPPLTYIHT
jgi:hypothetical protein